MRTYIIEGIFSVFLLGVGVLIGRKMDIKEIDPSPQIKVGMCFSYSNDVQEVITVGGYGVGLRKLSPTLQKGATYVSFGHLKQYYTQIDCDARYYESTNM